MDRDRAAERFERALVLADVLQDHAEAGERAEMARFARDHDAEIRKRANEILLQIMDRGALSVGFGKSGREFDHRVEERERKIVVLRLDHGARPLDQ